MHTWIPVNNIQMANNLMKWWRTKFLSGYKQFSDCNEGKISDTEELLGRLSPENELTENRPACTTPPPQAYPNSPSHTPTPASQDAQPPQEQLNLEEFSCDVSVEGGLDERGQERREFSFTLYDFDGHGKITKDDIAGLVTTIYEVLGSSVKVPHYGSKTIRVKLTVSPDQRKHVSATVIEQNEKKTEKSQPDDTSPSGRQDKKNGCHNSTGKRKERRYHCCNHDEEKDRFSDESDSCSRLSGCIMSEDEEGECTDDQLPRCNKTKHKKVTRNVNPRYTVPNIFMRDNNLMNRQEGCLKSRRVKKRSAAALQRQELLEIIQANMDKNNLSFQPERKPCNNHSGSGNKQQSQEEKGYKHRHRSTKIPPHPLQCLASIMDPTHFYVDLASLQNTTQLPNSSCQYNQLINAVMCVSNKKVPVSKISGCRKHNPPASNIPIRYQLLEKPLNNVDNTVKPKKTVKVVDSEPAVAFKKNVKKFPQVVLGHTSSPHHLRHRNRQEDQARAMAQVVHWLEQEFSSAANTGEEKKEKHKSSSWSTRQEKKPNSPSATESSIERHEHHHVHEHIHHHYHHYQETPIVV